MESSAVRKNRGPQGNRGPTPLEQKHAFGVVENLPEAIEANFLKRISQTPPVSPLRAAAPKGPCWLAKINV